MTVLAADCALELRRAGASESEAASLKTVSVIIPFTKPETVGNAIESVLSQDYPLDMVEIIIVGKGSQKLVGCWPQISAVDTGPIFRPGKARNLGAERATGEVLLFLDDDCEAQPGWIRESLAELESDRVGGVSGMIRGKSKALFARCVDFANFSLCQINQRQERPVCTATFAIRREVFAQVGGFDSDLKVHEDIDLCHRLEIAGYRTVYQPRVRVLHNHGRTTLGSLARYLYSGGRAGGLVIEEKYRRLSSFYRFLLHFRHPLVYPLMVVPFSIAATAQTVWANRKEHADVILLSPVIFVGKLSCHIGIAMSLWARQAAVPAALREMGRLVEYSLFKSRIRSPRVITLFVTSRCNAKCKHCFYWENLNQNNDMTFAEICELSDSLGRVDVLLISGGEPFLRRDLPEICELFFERNHLGALSIPTNGLQPEITSRAARRILEVARGRRVHIALSIDGTPEMHDEIRGVPGNFKRAAGTHKALLGLQREFPNLRLRVNSTVLNRNYESLFRLFRDHEDYFPGTNVPSLSLLRGGPMDRSLLLPPNDDLRALYEHRDRCVRGRRSFLDRLLDRAVFEASMQTLEKKTQVIPCEAGRIQGVVEDNGNVRHCELLPPIGNLREASFEAIWNSEKARVERKKIENKECHCTHECFLYPSLLAHPLRAIPSLVAVKGREGSQP